LITIRVDFRKVDYVFLACIIHLISFTKTTILYFCKSNTERKSSKYWKRKPPFVYTGDSLPGLINGKGRGTPLHRQIGLFPV